MTLVDTETPNPDRFARTADGKIDFDAYRGLTATYRTQGLEFEVEIIDSRQRFGHLDLLIVPARGTGQRWTEFKNLVIHDDPALRGTRVVDYLRAADNGCAAPGVVAPRPKIQPGQVGEIPASFLAPTASGHGTHWTEVNSAATQARPQVPAETVVATDLEKEVASMLGHVQIKDASAKAQQSPSATQSSR